jgi:transposase
MHMQGFDGRQRKAIRQQRGRPAADALHAWLMAQRQQMSGGSAIAKAIDCSPSC